jgi:hypothetical protein
MTLFSPNHCHNWKNVQHKIRMTNQKKTQKNIQKMHLFVRFLEMQLITLLYTIGALLIRYTEAL